MLYLDNAATTPLRPEVAAAMTVATASFGNPSSHHTVGEAAAAVLADARARVARVLGMRPGDIVFTSGGTESNNLALKGVTLAALGAVSSLGATHRTAHIITTTIEHESILASADYLERMHGVRVTRLPVDTAGRLSPASVAAAVRPDTVLISIGYANNEVGTVQDIAAIRDAAAGITLHSDAVQAAGWLPLSGLGADALSLSGHKFGAPQGTGVLALRGRIPLEPLLHGGGQERGRRSGTENVVGAVGLATALELADAERALDARAVGALRDEFVSDVLAMVPSAQLTGATDTEQRHPALASFTFADVSGEAVLLELERRGVVSSSGSACAAGSDEPSHVLLALGVPAARAHTAVRFTLPHGWRQSLGPVAAAVAASVQAVRS